MIAKAGYLGCSNHKTQESDMAWKKPEIREIALGAEINCYACAELSA